VADRGDFATRLEAARHGDAAAWAELYHHVAPPLFGYLRAQRLPDPDDVAGEVMLEVVRDLHRFQGDANRFLAWVLTIAHHRLIDDRRRAQRRPSVPVPTSELRPPPATDDPEGETLGRLDLDRLLTALQHLTEEQRHVLLLRIVADVPISEVARALDKRPGAIKQLQRRALDAMRRVLETLPESTPTAAPAPPVRPARHQPVTRAHTARDPRGALDAHRA
jgi:RNA polymerase sigma factor (sigma-70 family)